MGLAERRLAELESWQMAYDAATKRIQELDKHCQVYKDQQLRDAMLIRELKDALQEIDDAAGFGDTHILAILQKYGYGKPRRVTMSEKPKGGK